MKQTEEGPTARAPQPRLSPAQFNELLRLLGEIDEFKGYWRKLRELRAERLGELRQITTIESAGSSTRIGGAELSDGEVAQVLGGLSLDSFRARDESEVLIVSTTTGLAGGDTHPLVIIARFVVEFLAIQPFQDGNGRLSRALTTLLLLRTGYEYVPYASLERVIEENKASYYAALRTSQVTMRSDHGDFGEWLLFLLRVLRVQQQNLLAKLDVERSMQQLSTVQERILELVNRHGRVTSTLLATTLDLPPRTVRYHLETLIRHGLIEAAGEKRGRTYRRATGETPSVPGPDWPTASILAAVLESGGRLDKALVLSSPTASLHILPRQQE